MLSRRGRHRWSGVVSAVLMSLVLVSSAQAGGSRDNQSPSPPPVSNLAPAPLRGDPTPTTPSVSAPQPTPVSAAPSGRGGSTPPPPSTPVPTPVPTPTPAPAPAPAPQSSRTGPSPGPPSRSGVSSGGSQQGQQVAGPKLPTIRPSPTGTQPSTRAPKPVSVPVQSPPPSPPPVSTPTTPVATVTPTPVSTTPTGTTPGTPTPTKPPARPRGAPVPRTVGAQPGSRAARARALQAGAVSGATGPGPTATLLAGAPAPGASPFSAAGIAAARVAASRVRHGSSGSHPSGGLRGPGLPTVPGLIGNLVPLPVPDWSKPIIVGLLAVCLLLAVRGLMTARRARRLESQSHQLTADLEAMQSALVPAIPSRLGSLDVSVAYRPADGPAAGGDFYDAFTLDGGRVAFILGDVSGHGRYALARAAHMRYTLRAYVETGLDPRASLKLAGRVLGVEGDGLFTTVAIAVYDPDSATLTFASAGHPPPILAGPGAREPLTASASPALGWGTPTGRRQTIVPFSAGAQACFFSDGVVEARVANELLGRDGLANLFTRAGREPSARRLLEAVQEQAPTVHDDMAACVITAAAGTAPSEHRIEELEADLEQLEAGQGARFLAACGVEADEISPTIARAREIAAESGTVLLAVDQTGPGATATVCEPTAIVLTTPSASLPRGHEVGAGALAGRPLPLLG
jgi:hypothetical protein